MKGILKSLLIVLACVLLLSACANEQKEHYGQAAGHFEDGWYDQAMQYFERAGEYRDAKERYRESAYRAGLEYMNEPSGAAESGAEGNNFFRARYYFMRSEGYSDADQLFHFANIANPKLCDLDSN